MISAVSDFNSFLNSFFSIFTGKGFRGTDYPGYLQRPNEQRSGDEAPIVDTAIVGPLLGLLGFEPAARVYNQQRQDGRPDFAPSDDVYGICFLVEDKSTSLSLTLDLSNPTSHLSQLIGYMRSSTARLGWLTNGRQLTLWRLESQQPVCILDFDIPAALHEWQSTSPHRVSSSVGKALRDLYDLCRREVFSDSQRLEREIGTTLEEWRSWALPLGTDTAHEPVLVETLQSLVKELQADARRILDRHLTRYVEYSEKMNHFDDDSQQPATLKLRELQSKAMTILTASFQKIWGLEDEDIAAIETVLNKVEQDAKAFLSVKDVITAILAVINAARLRKYPPKSKAAHPMSNLDDAPALRQILQTYIEKAFEFHLRQATLRHDYQADRNVYDDYNIWALLVKETMLGGLNEEQHQEEFALQAAYVVFIRLLLIRVCEDKGIFPGRFISDGGLKHWQEDIERYFVFAQGNPYDPLLDMAYKNAQNVYAHFFTGRELFNWYRLDRAHFVMALHRLSRFNFAGVDSDIIGTIYNTYVNRKEKREKGQYYTPPAIVNYILDTVGYSGSATIGPNKRLIDPACGSGSFLVAAAKRFVAAYQGSSEHVDDPLAVLERIRQNLFGFDLNPFACYLAEVNMLIQMLDLVKQAHDMGQRPTIQRFHIYNVDALARPTGRYYYTHFNTLLAEENDHVDQVKSRAPHTPYEAGFAFVVANPPYGASLSDTYKQTLRSAWADVFYGQPDTYTFFMKLGLELLASNGKLGFITPNTYLMGKNTATLRSQLLEKGRIEQIVDLPQGIWPDANVDCVLLFLAADTDQEQRRAQQVQINMLGLRDSLEKLTERAWRETRIQQQASWMSNGRYEIAMRYDDLLQRIEQACLVSVNSNGNGEATTKALRLGNITESSQGVIVYQTQEEGQANLYIKSHRNVPPGENEWRPLLDGNSYVGRYELRWDSKQPHLKYGKWLCRPREAKFFASPKILLVRLRNKALQRRLVATYDDKFFFNRDNYNNIIASDKSYELKYILALFNSSLLNYWYGQRFDNVNINPDSFEQLPIYPADSETQATLVALVDGLLARHAELNPLRAEGYSIKQQRSGALLIEIPYSKLLSDLQKAMRNFPTLTFFDAKAVGLFSIPARCDLQSTISSNVYIPQKYPTTVVLRHNKLWLEVPDEQVRRYICDYLSDPQWQGKSWDELKNQAMIPENAAALDLFFASETQQREHIETLFEEIQRLDREIDERVLDLYGITNEADRERVLGSSTSIQEEEEVQ